MRYCQDCGDSHECAAELERDDAKTRVQLATIEANRDIRIAELGAQAMKVDAAAAVDIAEAEAIIGAAEAEGRAEGMETAIDDLSGASAVGADGQDGADLEAVPEFPVIEAEAEAEATPPPPDTPPPPARPKRPGWWDNYG